MPDQNAKNHTRYYTPHHFIFYPLLIALIVISLKAEDSKWFTDNKLIAMCLFMTGWLSFMMRQHYALGNQNRIIRLEMRLRYYQITGKRFEATESLLSFSQLAALRFASDEELADLVEWAVKNNSPAAEIKKAIKNWTPDYMRV